ncbi:unnamed protein product [Linum trigynum]|uniref:Uncharacterized protein n=1 Tax=Linum trigynum TaxID=586398 RepID=A0AAV2C9B6_9ROSI
MPPASGPVTNHDLKVMSVTCAGNFSAMPATITHHCHHESLTAFKLEPSYPNYPIVAISSDLGGFAVLTTLELRRCQLVEQYGCSRDPFAQLRCLTDLKLREYSYLTPFKVTGLELLRLEITCSFETLTEASVREHSQIFEVSASKLQSFCLSGHNDDFVNLRKVNLLSSVVSQGGDCDGDSIVHEGVSESRRLSF